MRPYPNFRDLERIYGITWHDLVDLEPKLARLLWESRQASVICRRWSDLERVFAPIRNSLADLVGYGRRRRWHAVLAGREAYEVAYWKLHGAVAALLPHSAGMADATEEVRARPVSPSRRAASVALTIAAVCRS